MSSYDRFVFGWDKRRNLRKPTAWLYRSALRPPYGVSCAGLDATAIAREEKSSQLQTFASLRSVFLGGFKVQWHTLSRWFAHVEINVRLLVALGVLLSPKLLKLILAAVSIRVAGRNVIGPCGSYC